MRDIEISGNCAEMVYKVKTDPVIDTYVFVNEEQTMIPKDKQAWREQYCQSLSLSESEVKYWALTSLAADFSVDLSQQPFVIRLFAENAMRHFEQDKTSAVISALFAATSSSKTDLEFSYYPSRVLMQDYTGVPAVADLAAMRDAVAERGGDPARVNPGCPVDLVIDHSVIVDEAGHHEALANNRKLEMSRNRERYQFLKWAQNTFDGLTVVPPGNGICHQINLEYFAEVVRDDEGTLIPDTLVGTDSHTTMINGLGVLGWGVGGIEAEAVMLGQPLGLNLPTVVGVKLFGELAPGATATDLVLALTERLRKHGVVGKYVEFYGPGVLSLSVADRATIANMSPEYGATCGLFPVDAKVLDYLSLTNRPAQVIERVEAYCKAQGFWYDADSPDPDYSEQIDFDIGEVVPSVSGPKRPQDRLSLASIKAATFAEIELSGHQGPREVSSTDPKLTLHDGDVVIAAITSCTNTSNPSVMLAAGLLAKAAVERGLKVKPWVKTSLAPGSQVVAAYLDNSGLQSHLDRLGFQRVGFGCTTCIGNSGPLNVGVEKLVEQGQLSVSAVLSGNRNFEGRIHPSVRLNWLASPPLVIAYALAGTTCIDLTKEPLGQDSGGKDIYLADLWPDSNAISAAMTCVNSDLYRSCYEDVLTGDEHWESLAIDDAVQYPWDKVSSYIQRPPFFQMKSNTESIESARILAILGDSITTDHISPAGQIDPDSPAGRYLQEQGVSVADFNSYGARRGNHEVMVRGTFANKRLKNHMATPKEGGYTRFVNEAGVMEPDLTSIYEASQRYMEQKVPMVVFAGKEYGTGSSRDWAAKGPLLQNVKAVIAESFERIHRSNLVGMGILPLQSGTEKDEQPLNLQGDELVSVVWEGKLSAGATALLTIQPANAEAYQRRVTVRIDNEREVDYFYSGGILPFVAGTFL